MLELAPGVLGPFGELSAIGTIPVRMEALVPVASLHDNQGTDRFMQSALRAEDAPYIISRSQTVKVTKPPQAGGDPYLLDVAGEVVAGGVTNPVSVAVSLFRVDRNRIRIQGALSTSMALFEIEPPEIRATDSSVRTRPDVQVSLDWVLTRKP